MIDSGKKKTALQKETRMDHYKFNELMEKPPEGITMRASSLAKIQDFCKKYATHMSEDSFVSKSPESKSKKKDIPIRVIPEPPALKGEKATPRELRDIVEKSRKALLHEYMEKIAILCENLPPFLEINVTIR